MGAGGGQDELGSGLGPSRRGVDALPVGSGRPSRRGSVGRPSIPSTTEGCSVCLDLEQLDPVKLGVLGSLSIATGSTRAPPAHVLDPHRVRDRVTRHPTSHPLVRLDSVDLDLGRLRVGRARSGEGRAFKCVLSLSTVGRWGKGAGK